MSEHADEVSAELELLDSLERQLLDLDRGIGGGDIRRDAIHSLFRNVHNLKGAVSMRGDDEATRLVHCIETALDAMRSGRIEASRELIDSFLAGSDGIRSRLSGSREADCRAAAAAIERAAAIPAGPSRDGPETSLPEEGTAKAVGFRLSLDETAALRGELARGSRAYVVEKLLDGRLAPARVAELPVFEAIRGIGRILAVRPGKAPEGRESLLSILFVSELSPDELSFVVFDPCRELRPAGKANPSPAREASRRDLRVEAAKLDKLFDLVGELITAEAALAACPEVSDRRHRGLSKAFESLSKITRELQETTMSVRMVPLAGLFDRMARLVRDLSRKTGKDVDFVVSGGDREMDKNAIEELADPLAHLLRNAVDHGIEGADERLAAGKAGRGRIELAARYEGSEVLISVSDDGGGIDAAAVLRKAATRGLPLPGPEDRRSEEDAIRDLVFLPGFSTAEVATEISGRGVGLDVVKRNVERLRGRIELSWKPGFGTNFLLRMPLTLSIVDAMTLKSGDCRFSIPVTDVREFFKPSPSQILRAEGERVALRGEFLPLLRLEAVLADAKPQSPGGARRPIEESIAVVVEQGGRRACLVVDEVLGAQQVVVRPMPAYAGRMDGLAGCSVNGDGGVGFIVDTGRLMARVLGSDRRA
jgi:two-component system chemotaxis sensor kinase CheA